MLTLKNLKINQRQSHETICFSADIYFKNKKIGFAENDGHGGCTFISIGEKADLKELEEMAKKAPKIENPYYKEFNMERYSDATVEDLILDLVFKKVKF